jgi:short subunit fatty acids transporter
MKRYFVILAMVFVPLLVNSQGFIDDVFNRYSGKNGFTSVVISPQLFQIIALLDKEDQELQKLSEKLISLKILVSEDKSLGFTNEIKDRLKNGEYLNLMEVIDGKQKVNFYAKKKGDMISDLLLLAIDENEEVMLSLTGNFKLNELSNLGSSTSSIGGMAHISLLKKLEEK